MKRLFLAVDIDEPTRREIGGLASMLRDRLGSRVRVSWVRPDRLHLTLHFEGRADEAAEGRLAEALADPLRYPAFEIAFEGLGFFPPSGPPRVLWLGLRAGAADLQRVHEALARRLPPAPAGHGGLTPHLTLGRIRDRVSRAHVAEIRGIGASAGPCRIDRVTLYESRLSPAGPTYVRIAEAPLIP